MASQKSTIVRSTAFLFPALEDHAPSLGSRLAENLWLRRPSKPKATTRHSRTPSGGEAFEVRWQHGVVRGRVYGDWGMPTAYLVHGWGGWWQQLSAFVQPLVDAGLCVVAFDAPSHGDSDAGQLGARSTTFVEMAQALAAVEREFGRATVVIAHSAGALVTMMAATEIAVGGPVVEPMHLPEALAFVSLPATIDDMVANFTRTLGVGPRTIESMRARLESRFGQSMNAFDLLALASRQTRLPRLLLVHDSHDQEAPISGAIDVSNAWHDSRLLRTEGLGHRRPLWDEDVVKRVAELGAMAADRVRAVSTRTRWEV